MMSEPTEQQVRNAERWHTIALMFGYNELAKLATTLGEKVYCRLMRDRAEAEYKQLGGTDEIDRSGDKIVLVLSHVMPHVVFTEKDIEMMRAAVRAHDDERAVGGPALDEAEKQRRSFAYGNTNFENANVTRALVDEVADELAQAGAKHIETGFHPHDVDTVIPGAGASDEGAFIVAHIYGHWPSMVVQEASSALLHFAHTLMELREATFLASVAKMREFFIYKTMADCESWSADGRSEKNADTMIHVLLGETSTTLVSAGANSETLGLVVKLRTHIIQHRKERMSG